MKPRNMAYCGIFGAAAILLPVVFHALQLGRVFMPMYLPLVLLAFYVPPGPAALTALLIPVLSGAVTGMPPFYPPVAPVMSLELALMAAVIGGMRKAAPRLPPWAVLGVTLLTGRAVSAVLFYAAAKLLSLPAGFVAGISLLSGWPGIALIMIVIPAVIRLRRHTLPTPARDPRVPFFDKIAPEWDGWHDMPKVREQLLMFLERVNVLPDERVLDIGCGTGNLTLALLERLGPDGRVTAADISPGMLALAKGKISDPRVTWLEASGERLPLPPQAFDRVVCFSVWPHLRDPGAALKEFQRMLRSGGTLHILHLISRAEVNRIHGAATDASVRGDLLPPAKDVAALVAAAGFDLLETADTDQLYLLSARKR